MSRRDLTGWLVGHTRTLLRPLTVSVVARVVGQVLGVAVLVVAVEAVVHHRPVGPTIGWLVALALTKAALRYLEHYSGHYVAFGALQRLRELFFARLIPQAPAATTGEAGAELTARATRDIDRIEVFFAHTLPPAVSAGVVPLCWSVWLAVAVSPALALAVAGFAVLTVLLSFSRWQSGQATARRSAALRGDVVARVGDDLQGVAEVLVLGAGERRLAALDTADLEFARARRHTAAHQGWRQAAITTVSLLFVASVAHAGTDPSLTAGQAAVALAVLVGLWTPLRGIDSFVDGLDAAFAATERVRRIVDAAPAVTESTSPQRPSPEEFAVGDITFDDVCLSYAGRTSPALDHVSVRFRAGEWTYVCGVSGGGKSTLLALLLRDRDPDSGTVRAGGVDLRDLELATLRSRIAIVDQRPTMIAGTVADNLRLGAPEATEQQLRSALDIAGLDLALGSRLGERGGGVSGGQLQRLALARALVVDPQVLILDEALSQLDEATAAGVRQRLADQRCTIIEVTHRVDTVPADAAVVVLDNGHTIDPHSGLQRLRARG